MEAFSNMLTNVHQKHDCHFKAYAALPFLQQQYLPWAILGLVTRISYANGSNISYVDLNRSLYVTILFTSF
jgi:hypothetical protein